MQEAGHRAEIPLPPSVNCVVLIACAGRPVATLSPNLRRRTTNSASIGAVGLWSTLPYRVLKPGINRSYGESTDSCSEHLGFPGSIKLVSREVLSRTLSSSEL